MFVVFILITVYTMLALTVQGKMYEGKTRKQAWLEVLKELK
jgi:hypothetical protein